MSPEREGTIPERIGEKGTCVGLCRERWPWKKGRRVSCGPFKAMTALCSTNVPGPCGPDKEEFAVKRPVPLPFSPA